MASESKMRKVSKKNHWGRGGRFLKHSGKGVKGLDFYNASQRQAEKKIQDQLQVDSYLTTPQGEPSSKIIDGVCMVCGDGADTEHGWVCEDCRHSE